VDQPSLIYAFAVLVWACVVTLAATALTVIVRNAPWVRDRVDEAKKPWACNVCMPLYTCAVVAGGLWLLLGRWEFALTYLPAYALTKGVLDKLAAPPGAPPPMHMPDDSSDVVEGISDAVEPLEEDLSGFGENDTDPSNIPAVLRTNRKV
jgi:hypothetical protein